MIGAHRNRNHLLLFIVPVLTIGLVALAGCITINPPSAPSPTPTRSPALQETSQDYVEGQWTLENRTANLGTEAEEGRTQRIKFTFDKPVDVWFEHIDYVIISIGGGPAHYPPHHTTVQDASGKPLYYFMGGVISFSYTITAVEGKGVAPYMLHIRPAKEGDIVTVTQRIYG